MPPITEKQEEQIIHEAFEISILLKGANALLQVALGIALLVTRQFADVLVALIQNELIEDPGDFFASHAQEWLHYVSPESLTFASLYLLSHGIVKLVLVWGLWRDKRWAYPASLAVLTLFILYQVIRWFSTHSIMLFLLTIFDIVVMWLIWHEWRHHRRHRA